MAVITFSPVEVFRDVVARHVDAAVVAHVVVGPLNDDQQKAGGVSLMDAGEARNELYAPLVWPRVQIRCIAPTLEETERIGRHVAFQLGGIRGRVVGEQTSTGDSYLVHTVNVNGGPSAHRDTDGTWEYLLFVETMMGTQPIPAAPSG
jgi:hypothetical protein